MLVEAGELVEALVDRHLYEVLAFLGGEEDLLFGLGQRIRCALGYDRHEGVEIVSPHRRDAQVHRGNLDDVARYALAGGRPVSFQLVLIGEDGRPEGHALHRIDVTFDLLRTEHPSYRFQHFGHGGRAADQ